MGNNASKNQKNLLNSEATPLITSATQDWSQIAQPLSQTQQQAIRQSGEGAVAAGYDAANQKAQQVAAASNNPVGLLNLEDTLGQQKTAALTNAATADTANIQNTNTKNLTTAAQGESSLGGNLSGQATSAANAQQQAGNQWNEFLQGLLKGAATGGAYGAASRG